MGKQLKKTMSECAWCKKIKTQAGWLDKSEAPGAGSGIDSFVFKAQNDVAHGICPYCAELYLKAELQLFPGAAFV